MDREAISYATVFQSETNYQDLVKSIGPALDFSACSDNDSRLRAALRGLQGMDLTQWKLSAKKDNARAEKARLQGNELYKKKKWKEALKSYSESILFADVRETETRTLALAIANRSACQFALSKFNLCTQDCDAAIQCGYPTEQRIKLYIRQAKSCIKTCDISRAQVAIQNGLNAIADDKSQAEQKKELAALQTQCKSIKKSSCDDEEEDNCDDTAFCSSKLSVKYTSTQGRFVVASEAMTTGESLLVEEPYAVTVYPDRSGFNCQNCLLRAYAFIPCPNCVGVIFCSVACRDAALGGFHKHECGMAEFIQSLGCSQVAKLALRMVSQKPVEYLINLKEELSVQREEIEDKSVDPYVGVYNLVGNNSGRWKEDEDRRAVMAVLLLKLLKHNGYGNPGNEDDLYIASLLFRNLQILQFNAFEVYETLRQGTPLIPNKAIMVGLAIYTKVSYLNHSCHGSVSRFFIGSKLCLRASRQIARGEEVQENYGPTFYFKGKEERQFHLEKRYWFNCICNACKNDWPLLKFLPTKLNLEKVEEFKKAKAFMDKGETEQAFGLLCGLLDTFKGEPGACPREEYIRVEDKLRTCITNMGSVVKLDEL